MIFDDQRDLVRWIPGRWETVGVSRRTWRRWMDGKARIPAAVVLLAQILVGGDLGAINPAWTGWRIVNGKLWDISDQWHTPQTVYAWWCTRGELDALKSKRVSRALRESLHARLGIRSRDASKSTERAPRPRHPESTTVRCADPSRAP